MSPIVEALLQRVQSGAPLTDMADWHDPKLYKTASDDEVSAAEQRLGFALPGLLRQIYLQVSNGGFGPGYGLIGIEGGATDDLGNSVEQLYGKFWRPRLNDTSGFWPDGLLPFCYMGCAIYYCVACSSQGAPVYYFEPNIRGNGPWGKTLRFAIGTLEEWFQWWLRGEKK